MSDPTFEIVTNDVVTTNMLTKESYQGITENFLDLPTKLKNIPDGIEVKNDPETVYASKTKQDSTMYYWYYKTTVKAVKEDIEITEFGSYTRILNHWEFGTVTGKPFEQKDFADWYKCKKGKMKKGKEYTDKDNWNRWPTLQKGKILWYYIGVNDKGEKFKGTATVNCMPEMKK